MIRRFEIEDAREVADLIAKTMRTTNIKDYSSEYVENDIKVFTPEYLIERSKWTHFYVACIDNIIVGCGAIGPYWGKDNESSFLRYLFCRNIRVKESVEKLLKHLNLMISFYKQIG